MTIEGTLRAQGFKQIYAVPGRASVADWFRPRQRSGVLTLGFPDESVLALSTTDVVGAYDALRAQYADAAWLRFKRARRHDLTAEAQAVQQALQAVGAPLRPADLANVPHPQTDFDLIMPPSRQRAWLGDLNMVDLEGERWDDAAQRRAYSHNFERFAGADHFREVVEVLRFYVLRGLPAIRRGEVSFWAVSCLPHDFEGSVAYARVMLNAQEVLTVYKHAAPTATGILRLPEEIRNEPRFSFHLAKSPLEAAYGPGLVDLSATYPVPAVKVTAHTYAPGGEDQIHLDVLGERAALKLLNDPHVVAAVRLLNLRLMRRGACAYGRYHCFDLADRLVSPLHQAAPSG